MTSNDQPFIMPSSPNTPPVLKSQTDSAFAGVIPYKNPQALLSYYLGLFSLIPCLGLLLSIPALILGIRGLRAARQMPEIKGAVHARVGVILGALVTVGTVAAVVVTTFAVCLQMKW